MAVATSSELLSDIKARKEDKFIHLDGELAQMVERSLSMREVAGSMPASSNRFLPHALEDFPNREWLNLVGVL